MNDLFAAVWTQAQINDLPDSSFAVIETGGEKDSEGKTKPRSLRHLPYKDASGKVDLPHLRNALARLDQTSISSDLKKKARTKLENAAKEAGVGDYSSARIDAVEAQSGLLLATVNGLQAVGRMISKKNLKTLMDAHSILGDLIQAAQNMESARVIFEGNSIRFEAGERLGTHIMNKRKGMGMTAADMARRVGISEQSYSNIENGYNSQPPEDILKSICAELGLDYGQCKLKAEMDRDSPVMSGYPMGRY
jgi:DNA-binding XRE family transcriptional regulator